MNDRHQLQQLRQQIGDAVAQRDALKRAIERGQVSARTGLRDLDELDARLSSLDTQFKTLWDASH